MIRRVQVFVVTTLVDLFNLLEPLELDAGVPGHGLGHTRRQVRSETAQNMEWRRRAAIDREYVFNEGSTFNPW